MNLWSYGFEISIGLISSMLIISAIILSLGIAVRNKRLQEFGKEEINQSFINSIILGLMAGLFGPKGASYPLLSSLIPSNFSYACPYSIENSLSCFAYDYLIGSGYLIGNTAFPSLVSILTPLLLSLYALNAAIGLLAGIRIAGVISLSQAFSPLLSSLQYIIKTLNIAEISVMIQGSLIVFTSTVSISLLMPLGLMLRSFYPSRKLGGFLTALSIGLYAVLPLSYILNALVISSYTSSSPISQVDSVTQSVNGGIPYSVSSNSIIIGTLLSPINYIISEVNTLISSLESFLGYVFLATIVLPVFSLTLTGISVRELSALLGSEPYFDIFEMI
ncbi:MAG: hypothetical protein QXL16_00370 [Candidatus Micrarchaeaceae archaeon]